jgi:hypothetical protein
MALNIGRWLKYAQARLTTAVDEGHRELDQLEAEREAELAERPWLASDGEAPTFDEARRRIEWEAEEQRRRAEASDASTATPPAPSGDHEPPAGAPAAPAPHRDPMAGAPSSGDDAEVAAARLELDERERAAKERLDAIREEFGIDTPEP